MDPREVGHRGSLYCIFLNIQYTVCQSARGRRGESRGRRVVAAAALMCASRWERLCLGDNDAESALPRRGSHSKCLSILRDTRRNVVYMIFSLFHMSWV